MRIGIVGAGVAGLAAARSLVEAPNADHEVVVFDKGRGPGGRISTRRVEPFAFDHGAQYFTARDPDFRQRVVAWQEQGVVAAWQGRIVALRAGVVQPTSGETERFVGTPRMSSLARHLAQGLEVRQGVRVGQVRGEERGGRWQLFDVDGGALGIFDRLIVTAPPAQATALLAGTTPLVARLPEIRLRPCWAVLLGLADRYEVDFDGAFCEDSLFSWIARNSSKPARPDHEAWVLHASPSWTESHLESGRDEVIALAKQELERITGAGLPPVLQADAQRWMFAIPDPGIEEGCLHDPDRGLVLAGDGYCGGRVEGAYRSGRAAARAVLEDRDG